jgi:hypothetical protein
MDSIKLCLDQWELDMLQKLAFITPERDIPGRLIFRPMPDLVDFLIIL